MMYKYLINGWSPFILAGFFAAITIIVLARYLHRTIVYLITTVVSLLSFTLFILSIFADGKWAEIGIGLFAIAILIGVNIGVLFSVFIIHK
jgi:hypothetical protein